MPECHSPTGYALHPTTAGFADARPESPTLLAAGANVLPIDLGTGSCDLFREFIAQVIDVLLADAATATNHLYPALNPP